MIAKPMIARAKILIGILIIILVLIGGWLVLQLRGIEMPSSNSNINKLEGRIYLETLYGHSVLLFQTSKMRYHLIGSKTKELKSNLEGIPITPWNVQIWGEKKKSTFLWRKILGTYGGRNIPQIKVVRYQGVNEGWVEGTLNITTACSYNGGEHCEEALTLNAKGGGKYNIVGKFKYELINLLKNEGEYDENLGGKRLKIKIYGKLSKSSYGLSPLIDVKEYQYKNLNQIPSDWQAYKNERYGYEVQHPKDWYIYDEDLANVYFQKKEEEEIEFKTHPIGSHYTAIKVSAIENPSTWNVKDYALEEIQNGMTICSEEVIFIGWDISALKIIPSCEDTNCEFPIVYASRHKKIYKFSQQLSGEPEIFNQMLSTFRFLE